MIQPVENERITHNSLYVDYDNKNESFTNISNKQFAYGFELNSYEPLVIKIL